MKAIVTGGAGFIGSHLVDRLLAENFKVLVLDNFSTGRMENLQHISKNKNLVVRKVDITDKEDLAQNFENADWVFHLAALADIVPSIQQPEKYYTTNVEGTFNVLEIARKFDVKKFLYAASSSCYGIPEKYPTAEAAAIQPEYPYALTKNMGEQLAMHWAKVYDLPVIALRLFNVYGPRSRTSGTYGAVFGVFLAQKLAGKPFTIVGNGKQTRDFTFVTDVADAFITAAKSDIKNEIFNVGSGNTYSINYLVELLEGEKVYIPKRPGEPDCTFADIRKIYSQMGWSAKISFEQGVQEVLKHIDYWKEAPIWTPDAIANATSDWFKFLGKA